MTNWKPIDDYEGLYEVSDSGQVRHTDGEIVPPTRLMDGIVVRLCSGGKWESLMVDYLVAYAFLPEPKIVEELVHKNGIMFDCRVENLEWREIEVHLQVTNYLNNFDSFLKDESADWIPVKGFESFFHVSNLGSIRSVNKSAECSTQINIYDEVLEVEFIIRDESYVMPIKNIVAANFWGLESKEDIVHKNGNWLDCRLVNLKIEG